MAAADARTRSTTVASGVTLPARPRWYHHIPEFSATIPCEGGDHQVTWHRGKFVLEDHDLSAERAMLVLGGEPCACLRALRMWRDQFGMPPELFTQMNRWLGADAVLAPAELSLVRRLGMTMSWARDWRRASYLDKHGRLLEDQLRELATPLWREHLTAEKQRSGARVISTAQVKVAAGHQTVSVSGQIDRVAVRATVTLEPWWLVEVWPRNLAVLEGAFVLELVEDSWSRPLVRAVRWDDRGEGRRVPVIALAHLERDADGGWHPAWQEASNHRTIAGRAARMPK
jgi:hypothetical protein